MTYATATHRLAIAVLAIALAVAVALGASAAQSSARTFTYNSAGSMVQQPLPSHWGCVSLRALDDGTHKVRCRA
jgi:hypothetical protein